MELVASTVSRLSVGGVFDVCGVCPRVFLKDELTSCPDLFPYCSYLDWLREKCEYMSGGRHVVLRVAQFSCPA